MRRATDFARWIVERPLFDYFVPESIQKKGDIEDQHARLLLAFIFGLILWTPEFLFLYLWLFYVPEAGGVVIGGLLGLFIAPFLL